MQELLDKLERLRRECTCTGATAGMCLCGAEERNTLISDVIGEVKGMNKEEHVLIGNKDGALMALDSIRAGVESCSRVVMFRADITNHIGTVPTDGHWTEKEDTGARMAEMSIEYEM